MIVPWLLYALSGLFGDGVPINYFKKYNNWFEYYSKSMLILFFRLKEHIALKKSLPKTRFRKAFIIWYLNSIFWLISNPSASFCLVLYSWHYDHLLEKSFLWMAQNFLSFVRWSDRICVPWTKNLHYIFLSSISPSWR